jgi:ATP-dependent Clp protease, protease subunit
LTKIWLPVCCIFSKSTVQNCSYDSMKKAPIFTALLGLSLIPATAAEEPAPKEQPAKEAAKQDKEQEKDPIKEEQEKLEKANALAAEKLKSETQSLRDQISRLQLEKQLLTEQMALQQAKEQSAALEQQQKTQAERLKLDSDNDIAKARAELLTNQLKIAQAESGLAVNRLQSEISNIEMEGKRKAYASAKPVYLENPLRADGTLVISDRRISLNGPITMDTADRVTERIDFFNNVDKKYPIFIVIDQSPGGSVMAGYRILKAMESSDAPVHVVVKSFAASMAAGITTLAKQSYCYPNAIILHHQISNTMMGSINLTQQEELVRESQRWWQRFGVPVAKKMGISSEEFIKEMYAHNSNGDWNEFGEDAQKLKWVDHIVQGIEETSYTRDPDAEPEVQKPAAPRTSELTEEHDASGKPVMYLPRPIPKDVYFMYNPDGYYRLH